MPDVGRTGARPELGVTRHGAPPKRGSTTRLDARAKATGEARYTADVDLPGMLHAAVTRSPFPRARIRAIDGGAATGSPGVVGVFTAQHVSPSTYGRAVRDVPILARGEARFAGERVAAVVATSRVLAERAAALVEVHYEELPAVTTPEAALAPGAPAVHAAPWSAPHACWQEGWPQNVQSYSCEGDRDAVAAAIAGAEHVVSATYTTPAGHQGYLEPWACVADVTPTGLIRVWATNKSPYRLREQLAECLGVPVEQLVVEPVALGGDFGGKGSPGDAPLCVELSRLTGRPVKLVLRYAEDLVATNPRHPARIEVTLAADRDGRLLALSCSSLLDGGAYAGFKPSPRAAIAGMLELPGYRIPAFCLESRIVYTNTVPKGHMRAPGGPQMTFAVESAMDELALAVGLGPVEIRRRNLLRSGEADAKGNRWVEQRGAETLDAALAAGSACPAPPGWLRGEGVAVYRRGTARLSTSLRLEERGGRLRAEVALVETGTGSHSVVRDLLARHLDYRADDIEVVQVGTGSLPFDSGASGSTVTASIAAAVERAAEAWRARSPGAPVEILLPREPDRPVGSYVAQVARVAVDEDTGQIALLELVTAVDVAGIVEPKAHQMQLDGGAAQGVGFALLEDLQESDGLVWAANLGEFKIPSSRDVPSFRTVLVPGGAGLGAANVKGAGELTNPPTAAAIANAVAAATGCRLRELPLRAERIFLALREREGGAAS